MERFGKILYGGLRMLGDELGKEEWRDARFFILLDENTFQQCLAMLVTSVGPLEEAEFIEVPVGEECKSQGRSGRNKRSHWLLFSQRPHR